MTTAKQKLQAAIDVAKNATQGRLHIGYVDENLDHAYIDTEDLTTIAEVYRRWDQVHFCNAAPSAYMQLAECALLLFEALEGFAEFETVQAPDGRRWPIGTHARSTIAQVAKKLEGM